MKKSTILIITAVFLISVFVVGIFGLQNVPYEEIVYVEKIIPVSITLPKGDVNVTYNEYYGSYLATIPKSYYENGMTLYVNYEITPNDATNKTLNVTINNLNDNSNSVLQKNGAIKMEDSGTIEILYTAPGSQGGSIKATLTVIVLPF